MAIPDDVKPDLIDLIREQVDKLRPANAPPSTEGETAGQGPPNPDPRTSSDPPGSNDNSGGSNDTSGGGNDETPDPGPDRGAFGRWWYGQ